MKLLWLLVLLCPSVNCYIIETSGDETNSFTNRTVVKPILYHHLKEDYETYVNTNDTSDEDVSEFKGPSLYYSDTYTDEDAGHKEVEGNADGKMNNDTIDKASFIISFNKSISYGTTPVKDVVIDNQTSNGNGTDIFIFLESMFAKVSMPGDNSIPMLNRKVFRGARVTITEHPYVVSIRRQYSHYLTGTLLTKRLVITIAHPLYLVPITELRVVVGENYNDRGTTTHTVLVVIIHDDFNPDNLSSDLAILLLYEEVIYKVTVKPIPIYPPKESIDGQTAFVTGWGRCDRSGKELCLPRSSRYFRNEIMDPMLRTVKYKVNGTSCTKYYKNSQIKYGMICAGDSRAEDLLSPCMAVPGAPLVVKATLAGMLSWGFGCGYIEDRPLVYTSTAAFQPWLIHNVPILRNMGTTQLTPLFDITKASYVMQWLLRTRVSVPDVEMPRMDEMHPVHADIEMAKLKGNIYDVRDFMFDRHYHNKKTAWYTTLRKQLKGRQLLKTYMVSDLLRENPFMSEASLNETDVSLKNGSLVENVDQVKTKEEDSNPNSEDIEYKQLHKTYAGPVVHF